ncbi:MAG: hypothetical protein LVQ97_03385 [Candidatus Micrarchaeales archaeon]|jgi:hypothetical protein|uniref:Uncharacterized protein n=1 Tax=Candidatus Micrarchaeum acidiphilum ARMAN-2 TaxID=425595 RepID=C7DGP3_MICA2|nr:MAG: hypothetical protein UNLARM2_0244 [Candidatus Micrarchaeum acidiphilum ARMAN-2]MCW6161202.1 hypothetical protein [Candidatus Micrarchaeales archaeon]
MGVPHISSASKSSPIWILVSAIPLQIGSIAAMLYVLSSGNKNKAYSLLFLIPIIGPIIAYVLTEQKDRYISSMAGWVFLGQILGYIILDALIALH